MATKSEINSVYFEEFKTSTSTVYCIGNNIVVVEPFPTSVLTEKAIKEVFDSVLDLKKGVKVKWLMLTAEFGDIDKSAVKMDTRPFHSENSLSIAVVTTSLSARLLSKFYFSFRKYPVPLKLFKRREEAILWLKNQ